VHAEISAAGEAIAAADRPEEAAPEEPGDEVGGEQQGRHRHTKAEQEGVFGVRAKIAQDLLDRAGLVATQVHQIVPMTEEPVMRFFADIDAAHIEINTPQPDPTPAIESHAISRHDHHEAEPGEIVEAEILDIVVEAVDGNDTPPRVAEMIKAGAFDGRPWE